MHAPLIMQQWLWRKIESTDAQDELLMTREGRANNYIDYIMWWEGRHRSSLDEDASAQLLQDMETSLSAFNGHPLIDQWLLQCQPTAHGARFRFKTLLLLGGSEQGKSQEDNVVIRPTTHLGSQLSRSGQCRPEPATIPKWSPQGNIV